MWQRLEELEEALETARKQEKENAQSDGAGGLPQVPPRGMRVRSLCGRTGMSQEAVETGETGRNTDDQPGTL